MLYKVRVGVDEYLGTPEEVVAWMARAEGAPGGGVDAYMRGIARRLRAQMGIEVVDVSSPTAFLDSLRDASVIRVEERPEASADRLDATEVDRALGDGPIAFGEGVEPGDWESSE
jgi:hypothetical protein